LVQSQPQETCREAKSGECFGHFGGGCWGLLDVNCRWMILATNQAMVFSATKWVSQWETPENGGKN